MNTQGFWAALEAFSLAGWEDLLIDRPWAFLLFPVALGAAAAMMMPKRRLARLIFPRLDMVKRLPKGRGLWHFHGARVSLVLVGLLMVLALMRPQVLGRPSEATSEGIDIVVVLDVSGSMKAADFRPKDRLNVAKQVIKEHLLTRKSDRIGLVVFAGVAYTQAPLTHDRALLAEVIDGVRTGVIKDGTAIGDATAVGINRLRDSQAKGKALILVTDGDNNAGHINPTKAAQMADDFGVRVFPILVGRGGLVPFPAGKDLFGKPRYQNMEWPTNPTLLKKMATITDGTFFSATNPRALAGSFQEILEEMDRSLLTGAPPVRRRIDLYTLLLAAAFPLFLGSLWTLCRRGSPLP